jgi:phytanoyl-CoA hydroxylase
VNPAPSTATGLSAVQQDQYAANGFLALEDLFSHHEMQKLKQHAIETCLAADTPAANVKWNAKAAAQGRRDQGALHSFWRPHTYSQHFRRLCSDRRITAPLVDILGGNVITFNGLVIFKMKEVGLAFPYHQDLWYFRKGNRIQRSCGIWLALDDADEDNGCLWVVPGSHRLGLFDHVDPEMEYAQDEFREVRQAREMDEIPVPLRAGSALFFDGGLLHRSSENNSDRDRTCWVIHNTSGDTVFGMRDPQNLERRSVMRVAGDQEPLFTHPADSDTQKHQTPTGKGTPNG